MRNKIIAWENYAKIGGRAELIKVLLCLIKMQQYPVRTNYMPMQCRRNCTNEGVFLQPEASELLPTPKVEKKSNKRKMLAQKVNTIGGCKNGQEVKYKRLKLETHAKIIQRH